MEKIEKNHVWVKKYKVVSFILLYILLLETIVIKKCLALLI